MASRRVWLLPAALAAAQLTLWPGLAPAHGDRVEPAGVALVLVIAAALGRRRRSPVAVTAVVAAGLGLGAWLLPGQQFLAPGDALVVIATADLIALFSVATLRSRRTTLAVLAALVLEQAALLLWQSGLLAPSPADPASGSASGSVGGYLADLLLAVCVYALVAAAGRLRRRRLADRAAAAHRLAQADQARREAATAERSRLARELHDVTAHHLTSIVVNASAAQFLAARRPELRAEALDFAARTGRDTLVALRRLVAVLPTGEPTPAALASPASLASLAADFRELGQLVTLDTTPTPPPEAILGIAREALTNTLRHAPGGTVTLRFRYDPDGAHLTVEDDGPAAVPGPPDHRATLGGGRGLTGMRTRAESLGGTLDAGPRPHGGWRVHARLPATPPPTGRPRSSRWSSRLALDAGLFVLTLVLPAAAVVIAVQEENLAPTPAALILLAVLAHTAPLLWRRRHPWTVLAAVALTTWLAPVLLTTTGTVWPFLLSAGADLAAVHAVAARGARPTLTWLAPFAATASTAYALGVLAALDPPTGIDPVPTGPWLTAFLIAVMAVLTGLVLAVPFGATWLAGHTARRRRDRRLAHEQAALAAVTTQTEIRTRAERARIAAGLHESVLEHTAAVPRAAEAADLPGVLGAARAALGEMRSLLDDLDTPAPSAPTPRATHTGKAAPGVQPVGPEGSPS